MKLTSLLLPALLLPAMSYCQFEVVATGLQSPNKILVTPGGNLLVSETSTKAADGRVSLVSRSGTRRSILENLPTGADVTTAGSGAGAMAIFGRTLYLGFGTGDAERRAVAPATGRVFNPNGYSSPLFASILTLTFNRDIDTIGGVFRFTPAVERSLNDQTDVDLQDGAGGTAHVSLLVRFPLAESIGSPTFFKFSNIWGLALTADGKTLYVSDASADTVSTVDTATGRWKRLARFPQIVNPLTGAQIDPVPTSVRIYNDGVLVSFLSGAPFVPFNARVLMVHNNGAVDPFIWSLTSAVDILVRDRNGKPQFFVLEFSENQSQAGPPPGVLLRYDTPDAQVQASGLNTPVSMSYDETAHELYIVELAGRILRIRLD